MVLMLDVFGDTPTGNQLWPALDQFFARGAPPPFGGGCARLATLASAPPPPKGGGGGKKDNLQKDFYTPNLSTTQTLDAPSGGEIRPEATKKLHLAAG